MFKEPTVLVLGAGASVPYGYPTGAELIEKVKSLGSDYNRFDIAQALKETPPLSIDNFLSINPSLASDGKFLIARVLLGMNTTGNSIPRNENDWYSILHHALSAPSVADVQGVVDNAKNLTIISFNYENSLEYHLFSRLLKTERFKDSACEIMNNIKIIHVYGSLFSIPEDFQEYKNNQVLRAHFLESGFFPISDKNHFLPYEDERYLDRFANTVSSNIKTIHDDRSRNQDAVDKLKAASKIYILGYGFDHTNNERIGLDSALASVTGTGNYGAAKTIYYTNYQNLQPKIDLLMPKAYGVGNTAHRRIHKSEKSVFDALNNHFPFP